MGMAMRFGRARMLGLGSGLVAGLLCRQAEGSSLPFSAGGSFSAGGPTLFGSAAICEQMHKKRPVVVCGPSGVGKGTLLNKLMADYPEQFGFSVSHTTRAPRPGEEDGVHYHFCDKTSMEAAIARGEFIEYARVHTNLYGTSVESVRAVTAAGKTCLLDIDVQGAEAVKRTPLNALFVFISPPSFGALEERLRGRGTETEEKIQGRLNVARTEMGYVKKPGFFDDVIVNDDLEEAYDRLKCILISERLLVVEPVAKRGA